MDKCQILSLKIYVFTFRERVREGEKEGEKHQSVASHASAEDLAHNIGMCPDQKSNPQTFALWKDTKPTEPHWSGLNVKF